MTTYDYPSSSWLHLRQDILEDFEEASRRVTPARVRFDRTLFDETRFPSPPRGRPLGSGKNVQREIAFELLSAGHSQRKVARIVGVNRLTVARWIRFTRRAIHEKACDHPPSTPSLTVA